MEKDVESKKDAIDRSFVRFFKFVRWVEKFILRVIFPYRKHGNIKKYNDGPIIIAANHYSVLDMMYLVQVTDRPVHFIAKSSIWKVKIGKWFADKVQCIPANRDGSDVKTLKMSMKVLKDGGVVAIYPEGTRNHSCEEMLPFHGGVAALSIKMQAPIIPVVQKKKMKFFRRNDVVYGDPVEFREFYGKKAGRADIEDCDARLREAMINMRRAFLDRENNKN